MPRTSSFASSLVLDADVMEEVMAEFESLKSDGKLTKADVKRALEITGFSLSGFEVRDLLEKEVGGVEEISIEMFALLYGKVREMKDLGRNFSKDKVLTEKKNLSVQSKEETHTAKHSISLSEQKGYASWMNRVLAKDEDCSSHLPIVGEDEEEIYDKCKDGLLMCKLINKAVKDTIDPRILNRGTSLRSVFKRNENLMLAVNSAESIGCCVVNIGPEDIARGTKHIVLGLVWQVIRIGLLSEVNLSHHKELVALLRDGETIDDLRRLSPEDLLLRWVNYHLNRAGIQREITNFKEDIMDSEIYANLIQQITPIDRQIEMIPVNSCLNSADKMVRAEKVLKNARVLEADLFVLPEDIAFASEKGTNRDKLNLAFVANLFNNYPALEADTDMEDVEETLEEKTYRNWMNSMGVKPYVTDLIADLQNGLVLLQMLDHIKPGVVQWKRVVQEFDPKKRKFQILGNCTHVVECAKQCDIKVFFSAENIVNSDKIYVLGLCFQMIRAYTLKILKYMCGGARRIEDAEILKWANERLQEREANITIKSFRDGHLASGKAVLHLIEAVSPGAVDFELVSDDNFSNCKLAVGLARRAGARVYALPDHLFEINKNMVMTIFATLMIRHHELQKQKIEEEA